MKKAGLHFPRQFKTMTYASKAFHFVLLSLVLLAIHVSTSEAKSLANISSSKKLQIAVPSERILEPRFDAVTQTAEAAWVSGMKNSVASILAAASSKIILAPFDTIKTLQQYSRTSAATAPLTLVEAAQVLLKRPRGVLELYAGIGVAVVGSIPSVGLYFGIYSFCKQRFARLDPDENRRVAYIALSAGIGNSVASASRVPYEVVKQKLQTQVYANLGEAIRDMSFSTLFPTGGIASQMIRDIPYAVVTLMAYEHLKHKWKPLAEEKFPRVPGQVWDLLVGGLAGGLGSYVTNPMDVIKTRLQTSSELYGGSVRSCVTMTFQEGGPAAFLRGSVPRLLHKVPANACFFLFYEFFRSALRVDDDVVLKKRVT
eukprot:scaffold1469_cov119-Cylindrotheca_fusiformis.AAC.28